jgi:hypothetical protein
MLSHVRPILASFAMLAPLACATVTPEQRAAAATIQVMTAEPANNCQNLGVVSGSPMGTDPGSLRAKAAGLGANMLHMNPDGSATAFYCPSPPPAR